MLHILVLHYSTSLAKCQSLELQLFRASTRTNGTYANAYHVTYALYTSYLIAPTLLPFFPTTRVTIKGNLEQGSKRQTKELQLANQPL